MLNEPVNQSQEWELGGIFLKLLEEGLDPNSKIVQVNEYPLIYAWKEGKYRSLIALLDHDGIDCTQKDELG